VRTPKSQGPKRTVGQPKTPKTTIGKPTRVTTPKTGIGKPKNQKAGTVKPTAKTKTGIGRVKDGRKPTNIGKQPVRKPPVNTAKLNKKPKNINIRGKKAQVFRDRRVIYRRGAFTALVGFGTLAAILAGTEYFDPDGYVAVAEPVCRGTTPDGCRLRWQDVPTEDGGTEPHCVEYCPRAAAVIAPAPAAPVAPLAETPAGPVAGCEMVVFKQPNFGGEPQSVTEDESELNEDWDKQIASIQVKAGTWDVFAEEEFGGASLSLPPGTYATLGNEWTGKISSVKCSEPAR
jgi:hypothetical protein